MNVKYEVATGLEYPNITILRRMVDGVCKGYRVNANDGYVIYDATANNTEIDPETMKEAPVAYYFSGAFLPSSFNFERFPYVAARISDKTRSSV